MGKTDLALENVNIAARPVVKDAVPLSGGEELGHVVADRGAGHGKKGRKENEEE